MDFQKYPKLAETEAGRRGLAYLANLPKKKVSHVAMLGAGVGMGVPRAKPAPVPAPGPPNPGFSGLGHLLNDLKPEKFSGFEADWPNWSAKWKQYFSLWEKANPGHDDSVRLTVLTPHLDDLSTIRLNSLRERNPALSFLEFWRELEQRFACDLTEKFREAWEGVSMDPRATPTLQEYRAHYIKWEAAYQRVVGVSVEEATRKFLSSLPGGLFEAVLGEELRTTTGRFWVQVPKDAFSADDVVGLFVDLLGAPPRLVEGSAHFILECGTAEEQTFLLSFDGVDMGAGPLRISKHTKKK